MVLLSVLGLFFLLAARRIHNTGHQAMMLQASNRSLIDYLNRARSDAEALNEKLAQEIYERKEARQRLQETNERLETMVQERTQALEESNQALGATGERLELALEASNIGLWDWMLDTGRNYHTNFDRLLGYDSAYFKNFFGDLETLVHPEDLTRIRRAMVAHFKGDSDRYHAVYRLRHADGSWRWIEDDGRVVKWSEKGRATRMIGTRRDITEDRQAQEQQRLAATVFENAPEGIFILDQKFRFLAVNARFEQITGCRNPWCWVNRCWTTKKPRPTAKPICPLPPPLRKMVGKGKSTNGAATARCSRNGCRSARCAMSTNG